MTYIMVWVEEKSRWHYFVGDFDKSVFPNGFVDYYIEVRDGTIVSDTYKATNEGRRFEVCYDKTLWETPEIRVASRLTMENFEQSFEYANDSEYLGVAVIIGDAKIPEIILNSKENFASKLEYYKNTYDEKLCMKKAPHIRIVGWVFSYDFKGVEDGFKLSGTL